MMRRKKYMNISIDLGTNVNGQMDICCSYMIKVQNTHILGEGFYMHREMRCDKLIKETSQGDVKNK